MTDENTTTTASVIEEPPRALDPRLVPLRSRTLWLRCLAIAGCGYGGGVVVALVALLLTFAAAEWKYFSGEMILTGPVQLVGAATGGILGVSVRSSMAGGSISVFAVPMLVTAAIVIGLTIAARRQRIPAAERIATAIVSGVILAAGSTVLAAICTQTLSSVDGSSSASGAASISAASFTGAAGAAAVGFGVTWLASGPAPWLRRLPVLSLRSALGFLAVVGGLATLAAIVILLVAGQPLSLLSLPLAGPSFALDAAVFATGGSIGTFGGIDLIRQLLASLDGTSTTTPPDLSLWSGAMGEPAWFALLIPAIGAILAALLISLGRRERTATVTEVLATVGSFAAIGLGVQFLPVIAVGYSFPLVGSGTVGAGPAAWTFLVFAVWGAVTEAASRWLAPIVLGLLPERFVAPLTARFGAAATHAAPPAATTTPASESAPEQRPLATAPADARRAPLSRRTRLIALAVTGVLVLGIGATATSAILRSTVFGPGAAAQRYLDALEEGDATTALELGDVELTDQDVLLTDAAFADAAGRIRAAAIGAIEQNGDLASVPVTYRIGDQTRSATLTLTRTGTDALFADRWTVADAAVGTISVTLPRGSDGRDLVIGDETVPMPEPSVNDDSTSLELRAFPGTYEIGLGPTDFLKPTSSSRSIDALSGDGLGGDFGPGLQAEPNEAFEVAAVDTVTAALTECAASTVADPAGCPFGVSSWSEPTNITYAIAEMPELEFDTDPGWAVSSVSSGTVTENYDYAVGGSTRHQTTDRTFSVYASVDIVDGEIVLDSMR